MDPFRIQKAEKLRSLKAQPYASSFPRTHLLDEGHHAKDGAKVKIAGRVVLNRTMGKMTFMTLKDGSGKLQIAFKEDIVGKVPYTHALSLIDLGDVIGITGERFTTQTGEPTVLVKEWMMLTKALRQPPEKWHGIADQETAWRQRYLDLMSNDDTFARFQFRSLFLKKLREYYWAHAFTEVETPILVNAASGALATPFQTHHAAYDLDISLRIAPETFLKECLIGGFDRVFEIGRVFRNEGLDPSHLQDFTMVEHYAAYWNYEDNMRFMEAMISTLVKELKGSMKIKIPNRDGVLVSADFTPPWPRVTMRDAIKKACDIDIDQVETAAELRKTMEKKGVELDVSVAKLGRGNLIDQLYKKVSRPSIIQPTFLVGHPLDLSPLARRNDENPAITDRFQLVTGGWEIVNGYSELIDPIDQAERFEQQAAAQAKGDTEAHGKDDEFVKALAYGCPPASGQGMGIDRVVALLTQQTNLREVVLFPLMKPEEKKSRNAKSETPPRSSSLPRLMPSAASPLPQASSYGHLLPAAHTLLAQHADKTTAHLLATGAAMQRLAERFGGDPETWKVAGILHDLDWDHLEKDAEEHCGKTLEQLLAPLKAPAELLADIRAHYAEKYGDAHPLDSMLRKCLYCVDELTGFIIAVTLVRPDKKLGSVEVKSVKKKLKEKSFAAQVNREQIFKCEEILSLPLDEFIAITLSAMQSEAAAIEGAFNRH